MSELLDDVLEELKALPEDAQDAIAADLLEMIRSERKWDQLFADPRSDVLFDRLIKEADEEAARGEVFDFDPATRPAPKAAE